MKKIKSSLEEWYLTAPSFVWLLLFFLIPTIIIFAFAFKKSDLYGAIAPGWTLENIYEIFDSHYLHLIGRTLTLSAITTFLTLSIALPICYQIARSSELLRKVLLLLIIVPFWSSFLVRIFAWKSLLHPEGVLKNFLVQLHIINESTSLLYNEYTVVLVMVYTYLPFAVLPIYSAAAKFNFQLLEAASDLGATKWARFTKVFIPSIKKGLLSALVMVFISAVGAYVIPDLVGGTQSEMIGNKIAQRTFLDRNLPIASALSALLSLIILLPLTFTALFKGFSKNVSEIGDSKE